MTDFGRFPAKDLRSLTQVAVDEALADAGITPPDVQMVVFGNAAEGVLHGQEMIRGEVALRHAGLQGVPVVNVENACASSSSAFAVACMAVGSGAAEVVLVVGAEQLTHPVKARSFAALATAVDLGPVGDPTPDNDGGRSPLMDLYAARSRAYMAASGATAEDGAAIAVKNRRHASRNPKAQFRTPVTLEEVLDSRMIADPLRLLMCAPIGDGAAAVVVTTADRARHSGRLAVAVEACALTSNGADEHAAHPVARAAARAYEQAGIGPEDVDVVEVHDACAPAELWIYEELGLCPPGGAADLLRSGATTLGGRVPVNTGGGLLSRGHPLGATGCAQLVELADQLRGRSGDRQMPGARLALAENSGGILDRGDEAVAAVTVLRRVD